ncbi:hypothetical protein FNYG_15126 [Fusarium nygamai]|uniref:Enoyl reductase (ER) domain-containing protein n=1 Tax=Gibberella nygamai TaxID=42673 RepID=A0A2K0UKS0_GIBNY|nr:hypothetical protein FNYG_15126 [Fusarium nygamai]
MASSPAKSRGLYIDGNSNVVVRDLPFPEPQDGEILIKVLYSGANPADTKLIGIFALKDSAMGYEFCGEVLESANLDSTSFKVGDIVVGLLPGGQNQPLRHYSHQEYVAVDPSWVFKIPQNLPPQAAAGLSVVGHTASSALFVSLGLPLPPSVVKGTPDEDAAVPKGTLVIWGGATGVGMAAIQLARAARVSSIIAIASTKRHEFLKTLGATQCFDYNDVDVVDKVKSALQATNGTIWALDAVGRPEQQALLKSAISQHDKIVLATVMIGGDPEYEVALSSRHFDIEFEFPGGQKWAAPKDMAAADRHWRGFRWIVEKYGSDEYVPTPVRLLEGSGEDAIQELFGLQSMKKFGKLVFKHPLQ